MVSRDGLLLQPLRFHKTYSHRHQEQLAGWLAVTRISSAIPLPLHVRTHRHHAWHHQISPPPPLLLLRRSISSARPLPRVRLTTLLPLMPMRRSTPPSTPRPSPSSTSRCSSLSRSIAPPTTRIDGATSSSLSSASMHSRITCSPMWPSRLLGVGADGLHRPHLDPWNHHCWSSVVVHASRA